MILSEKTNVGIVSNVGNDHRGQVTITMNAKAFSTLSDTLYQDKVGSIVRELSSNAFDSHVQAGIGDLPFHIHLPSVFEPYFSVKDFGIGMDDETVENVFTSLFASTKETTNDCVGAFGLGAKTPFSYTDMFTVIAIKDGVSRTYSLFKDEDGLPGYAMLGQIETSEHNGVEIILPVNVVSDRAAFARAIAYQLHFFPVRPIIIGGDYSVDWSNEPTDNDIVVKYNNITTFKKGQYRNGCYLVMGPVGYELNYKILNEKMPNHAKVLSWLSGKTARIYFNIGDVSVTPSRENLSYDPRTLKAISKAFDGYIEEVSQKFTTQLAVFNSPWERAKFIYECNDDIGNIIKISANPTNDVIVRYTGRFAYFDVQSIQEAMGLNACALTLMSLANRNSKFKNGTNRICINDFSKDNNFILLIDSCKYMKRRLVTVQKEFPYTTVWTVECNDQSKINKLKEVIEKSGIATKLLSEYIPANATNNYSFVKKHGYVIKYDNVNDTYNISTTSMVGWDQITDKAEIEPGFYVASDYGKIHNDSIAKFRLYNSLGLIPKEFQLDIYAFPLKTADKLSNDEEWIDLPNYIKENFEQSKIDSLFNDVWESMTYANALEKIKSRYSVELALFKNMELKNWLLDFELALFDKIELANSFDSDKLEIIKGLIPGKFSTATHYIVEYVSNKIEKIVGYYPLIMKIFSHNRYNHSVTLKDSMLEYIEMYNEKHGSPVIEAIDMAEIEKIALTWIQK